MFICRTFRFSVASSHYSWHCLLLLVSTKKQKKTKAKTCDLWNIEKCKWKRVKSMFKSLNIYRNKWNIGLFTYKCAPHIKQVNIKAENWWSLNQKSNKELKTYIRNVLEIEITWWDEDDNWFFQYPIIWISILWILFPYFPIVFIAGGCI